jgi:glc operon protein GlcG
MRFSHETSSLMRKGHKMSGLPFRCKPFAVPRQTDNVSASTARAATARTTPATTGNHPWGGISMRRLTMLAGAVGVALMMSTGAFAQVPADPSNPNETVPDAMAPTPYGEPINLETAKKVAAAAVAEMKKRNWSGMCISIVGPSGDLVYFERDDNCQYASIAISQHKARTAARYRRPTVVFERLLGKGPNFSYLPTLDDVIASRGGNPLIVNGKVIGAIGASGGAGSQDDTISQAGAAALK